MHAPGKAYILVVLRDLIDKTRSLDTRSVVMS